MHTPKRDEKGQFQRATYRSTVQNSYRATEHILFTAARHVEQDQDHIEQEQRKKRNKTKKRKKFSSPKKGLKGKGKKGLPLKEYNAWVKEWGDERKAREYFTKAGYKLPC